MTVGRFEQSGIACGIYTYARHMSNLDFIRQYYMHSFLGKGRPDDVAGQVFHRRIIVGRDAVAAEDVEAGMPPSPLSRGQVLKAWRSTPA